MMQWTRFHVVGVGSIAELHRNEAMHGAALPNARVVSWGLERTL